MSQEGTKRIECFKSIKQIKYTASEHIDYAQEIINICNKIEAVHKDNLKPDEWKIQETLSLKAKLKLMKSLYVSIDVASNFP
ncbi:MAG: hypothetical protein OXE99_06590 [Cellvibrionales bacterium]|nr:hypothetical protein [Cellvibrionales bacterium]